MGLATVKEDMADDPGMGFRHKEQRSRCDRISRNADGIGVEREGSRPRLPKDVEKGSTETFVPLPLRVRWKMLPLRGPVAHQFAVRCGRCSGEMGDPGIDPPDRIDRIRTIRGDPVTDKEIIRNRFIHPFFEPMLFFNHPSAIADFPDLIGGMIERLAKALG